MSRQGLAGRRFYVRGRVQGVGFRDFVQREARQRNLKGYVRNLSDGSVLVCAVGDPKDIDDLDALLREGPRWASVREVSVEEIPADDFDDFRIVH